MFSHLYRDPRFVGATTSPPNTVTVIMEDGIEYYESNVVFRSEATIDKQSKEVKGTVRGKEKITQLFVEPTTRQKGRFTVTQYEL
jgi:aspartate carbamoyltransferase catalytic subunit